MYSKIEFPCLQTDISQWFFTPVTSGMSSPNAEATGEEEAQERDQKPLEEEIIDALKKFLLDPLELHQEEGNR